MTQATCLFDIVSIADKLRFSWIDKRLGQLGINVRQHDQHMQMRYYIELLKEEIEMTERFLVEDGQSP